MKILIIRFSSIGDIVLTTPVVRCVKRQLPDTEVHFLTKEAFRPVVESNPNIDRVITIGRSVSEKMGLLKEMRYDYIADLHKNLRSWRVLLELGRPFGTFSKLNIRKWLICRMKIDLLPDVHIVDRYFHAVRRLGVGNDGLGLDYFVPEGTDPLKKMPELPRDAYIALVIGGKHATKQMPAEKLMEVIGLTDQPVVILGGMEDKAFGDRLLVRPGVWNACGLLSLHESAVVLRDAARVITHDTGLMHMAAAFRKDITSIWGNTIPEFGMYPYLPKGYEGTSTILEVKGLSCRPCSKLGYPACPKGHFRCMKDIVIR